MSLNKIKEEIMKKFLNTFIALTLLFTMGTASYAAAPQHQYKPKSPVIVLNEKVEYITLQTPTAIVLNPYNYMNKYVQFPAKFNKFSTLGLDYKPAMRESQVYIGMLIERDDVADPSVVIPLSEMKIFMKRSYAEKFTDLNARDRIFIKGKVFSTALGDPWLDIIELKVLPKTNGKTK